MPVDNLFEKYETILVFKKQKKVFLQLKNGKPYKVTESSIEELPYSKIVDKKRNFIRVYNIIDNVKKWGIINSNGIEIVPPIYDYISQIIGKHYFKVFSGDFQWEFHRQTANLYYDFIDPINSWNETIYKGTLGYGRWGLIGNERIPIVYEWIEFISDSHILCNIGGSRIIKWYDGNDYKKKWAIIDGKWEIRDGSKIVIPPGSLEDVMAKFNELKSSKKYPLYKQSIGKYSTKTKE